LRFTIANATGALAWGILFPLVGFFGGTALQAIVGKSAGWVTIGVLTAIAIVSVARHIVRRRRRVAASATSSAE
jgi:membrane protein DedA with SNARE-associated domain